MVCKGPFSLIEIKYTKPRFVKLLCKETYSTGSHAGFTDAQHWGGGDGEGVQGGEGEPSKQRASLFAPEHVTNDIVQQGGRI